MATFKRIEKRIPIIDDFYNDEVIVNHEVETSKKEAIDFYSSEDTATVTKMVAVDNSVKDELIDLGSKIKDALGFKSKAKEKVKAEPKIQVQPKAKPQPEFKPEPAINSKTIATKLMQTPRKNKLFKSKPSKIKKVYRNKLSKKKIDKIINTIRNYIVDVKKTHATKEYLKTDNFASQALEKFKEFSREKPNESFIIGNQENKITSMELMNLNNLFLDQEDPYKNLLENNKNNGIIVNSVVESKNDHLQKTTANDDFNNTTEEDVADKSIGLLNSIKGLFNLKNS